MSSTKIEAKAAENFKTAWHASIHDPEGPGIKMLADIAGISPSTLYASADEEQPEDWPSMKRFIAILPALRNITVLDYLGRLANCVVFRMPDPRYASGRDIGAAIKEFGEWVMAASEGDPDEQRLARLEKEGREAIACIAGAIEAERLRLGATTERKLQVAGGVR